MILLIDGNNLFMRNYAVVPTLDEQGEPSGGVIGFMKSMKVQMRELGPSRVVVAWDGQGGSQRRRSIFSEYKAGRKVRVNRTYDFGETPERALRNMAEQMQTLKTLLEMVGVIQVEIPNIEADDTIAFACKLVLPDEEKVVVSSDKDLLQLVDEKTLIFSHSQNVYWSSAVVKEKLGVIPENYIYVKALSGDGGDNIKGLAGVGPKTVVKIFPFLVERPTTLDELFAHAEGNIAASPKYKAVLENKEMLRENVDLMQLSSPVLSAQAARTIRETVKDAQPKFNSTGLKLELTRRGLGGLGLDFFEIVKQYRIKAETKV